MSFLCKLRYSLMCSDNYETDPSTFPFSMRTTAKNTYLTISTQQRISKRFVLIINYNKLILDYQSVKRWQNHVCNCTRILVKKDTKKIIIIQLCKPYWWFLWIYLEKKCPLNGWANGLVQHLNGEQTCY